MGRAAARKRWGRPARRPETGGLTDRELDILIEVARGRTDQEIASQFVVTEGTVKTHIRHILRKLNVPVPPNASPGKAMQILANTCRSTDCHPILQSMGQYNVTAASLDASGKATLNATAATGTYFFYAIVRTPQGTLMWDIPVNLAAGDNSVTITRTNAELIQ